MLDYEDLRSALEESITTPYYGRRAEYFFCGTKRGYVQVSVYFYEGEGSTVLRFIKDGIVFSRVYKYILLHDDCLELAVRMTEDIAQHHFE